MIELTGYEMDTLEIALSKMNPNEGQLVRQLFEERKEWKKHILETNCDSLEELIGGATDWKKEYDILEDQYDTLEDLYDVLEYQCDTLIDDVVELKEDLNDLKVSNDLLTEKYDTLLKLGEHFGLDLLV